MNIPENAVEVKLVVSQDVYTKKTPVYISIPTYVKPLVEPRIPLNVTAQAVNSDDRSVVISVDQWKSAYDFADPAKTAGKERDEYITAVEQMVNDGILTPIFINEAGEEMGPDTTGASSNSIVNSDEEF